MNDSQSNEYELQPAELEAITELQREVNLQLNGMLRLIAKTNGLNGNWALDATGKKLVRQ